MNRNILRTLLVLFVAGVGCFAQTAASREVATDQAKESPAPSSKWYVRVGVAGIIYHPGALVTAGGAVVPGASATVTNNVTVIVDGGYYFTKHIAATIFGGIPPKPTLSGTGTIAPYGNLGSLWYAPPILSTHYHFLKWGPIQPYAGGGVGYAIILKKHNEALKNLQVHNNFAPVAQAGTDYMFNKKWGAFVDCKQAWLSVDAHGNIEGVVPAKARVKLYPTIVSAGLTYRF
jgi:outer membrane protein